MQEADHTKKKEENEHRKEGKRIKQEKARLRFVPFIAGTVPSCIASSLTTCTYSRAVCSTYLSSVPSTA